MTGDGRADVVIGEAYDPGLQVFAQRPDGTLGAATTYPTLTWPSVQVGDVTGDGRPDVVSAAWTDTVEVRQQTPQGTLGAPATYSVPIQGFNDLELGDVTGDGRTDVVTTSGQGLGPRLFVLPQLGSGRLDKPAPYALPDGSSAFGLGVGDVTGDGRQDVLVSNGPNSSNGHVYLFEQGLGGSLLEAVTLSDSETPGPIEIADLDGNGREDVVVVHPGWGLVGVHFQSLTGGLAPEELHPTPYVPYGAQKLDLADVDHNGTVDVAVAGASEGLILLLNRTSPGAPTIGSAAAGNEQATVSWTAPGFDGGSPITGYVVTPYVGYIAQPAMTFASTATTQVVTGLTNGKQYRFRVQATNAIGTGGFSTVTNPVTPSAPPAR